ncbi:MAG: hypothetical protein PWP24_306 [Clostridiales bacterium]|nr:hypothetical protein [Clostridiales bacterium]
MEAFDKDHFMSLNILKKEVYTGSKKGMRYRLERIGEKPDFQIKVSVWPEPFCFDKTEETKITSQIFSFDEDGKNQIVDWLNEIYTAKQIIWKEAYKGSLFGA